MKAKTILSFIETLTAIKESGMTISKYCENNGLNKQSIYDKMQEFKRTMDQSTDTYNKVVSLYNSITNKSAKEVQYDEIKSVTTPVGEDEELFEEEVDSDSKTEVSYQRNTEGKIVFYNYKIYRKKKTPLVGKLTRDEMNIICRLYSYYGASLTQREVSRYFPELSLVDFKRILSAFGIYKASAPFAPHIIEETSSDELRDMQLREKENDFLKKIEEDRIKNNEKLLKKYAVENADLKRQIDNIKGYQFEIQNFEPIKINKVNCNNNSILNLYIADMHIGAKVCSGTLYDENISYDEKEAYRRLTMTIEEILKFKTKFDTINVCLMGDMIDCCGPTNKTARLDHSLPENMDGFEQANNYISLITNFISKLNDEKIAKNIKLYSVRCGNHTGVIEYIATRALFAELRNCGFECKLFDDFFGVFKENNHTFILTHGKDDRFMKRGLPLNLDDKNKVLLYEWLNDNGLYGDNIHIVKGDLHSNNYNSCKRLDYRNVLSLFGASDYSSFNFSRNSYGISYDYMIGDSILRGEFQNM